MITQARPSSLTRREALYYFWFAALLLTAALSAAFVLWALTPPSPRPFVLSVADFAPRAEPYFLDDPARPLFIVNTGDELLVFDAFVPHLKYPTTACRLIWREGHFDDPCWGSKFDLHGHVWQAPAVRDLDWYAYELRDGQLVVELSRLIEGEYNPP